jgi:serine protease AprX
VLDVFATFDTALEDGEGNTIGILLTDPNGVKYSSGIAIPILDGPTRQVVVKNPAAGPWLLEVRGVRGLAAAPNVSLPTSGAAAPGPVDITIAQQQFTLAPIADIQQHEAKSYIETALKNRMMDTLSDGLFHPDDFVTREDLALSLYLNTSLRQSLGATPKFNDVTGNTAAIAEAVTANGSTLRDWNFVPQGVMTAAAGTFAPTAGATRFDLAIALVRALGLDSEARAKAGTNVTVTYNGQTIVLADNAGLPAAYRGYIQYALDKGILQAYFSVEQGPFDLQPTLKARVQAADPVTRAWLAFALSNYWQHFVAGN